MPPIETAPRRIDDDLRNKDRYDSYASLQRDVVISVRRKPYPDAFFIKMAPEGGGGNHLEKYQIMILAQEVPQSCQEPGKLDSILKPDIAVVESRQPWEPERMVRLATGIDFPAFNSDACLKRRDDVEAYFERHRGRLVEAAKKKFEDLINQNR